jgi:uncharacterized membrane protein
MRSATRALVLSLGVVACSADRAVEPAPAPHPPRINASLNLGLASATELYQSTALAINDSGVVVGYAQVNVGDRRRAAVWRPPDYHVTILPDLGAQSAVATSIGNDGTMGGRICDTESASFPCHPVYWRSDVLHQLGGVGEVKDVCPCDGHTLIGRTIVDGRDHAAIWEDDVLIDIGTPAEFVNAEFVAIARGNIVGMGYFNSAEEARGIRSYRWSPTAGWIDLGTELGIFDVNSRGSVIGGLGVIWLNGSSSATAMGGEGFPASINDSNVVAGSCVPDPLGPNTDFLPCEWTSATGWYAIGSNLFAGVSGINNSNEAVGFYFSSGRSFALLWRP